MWYPRRPRSILLTLGIALWVSLWFGYSPSHVPLTPSPQTTHITSPLTADGRVDYVAAYNAHHRAGVTRENNALYPLLDAIGPAMFDAMVDVQAYVDQIKAELGIDVKTLRHVGPHIESLNGMLERLVGRGQAMHKLHTRVTTQPWPSQMYPEIAQWILERERTYAHLHEASRRSSFYLPLLSDGTDDMLEDAWIGPVGEFRSCGTALRLRAIQRLGDGDPDGAIEDAMATIRLGRLVAQQGTVLAWMVGISIEAMGHEVLRVTLEHADLAAAQLQDMAARLKSMPAMPDLAEFCDRGERWGLMGATYAMQTHGVAHVLRQMYLEMEWRAIAYMLRADLDFNIIAREFNRCMDRVVAGMRLATHAERVAAEQAIRMDYVDAIERHTRFSSLAAATVTDPWTRRGVRSQMVAEYMVLQLASVTLRLHALETRYRVHGDLLRTALALESYRIEQGRYPDGLASLVPDYLDAVPMDRFDEQPLRYQRSGQGYILYSVGMEGVDNAGRGPDDDGSDIIWTLRQPRDDEP